MKTGNLKTIASLILLCLLFTKTNANDDFKLIPLVEKSITEVQPMTGIVYWSNDSNDMSYIAGAVQLEFAYIHYNEIVSEKKYKDNTPKKEDYNWNRVEEVLNAIKSRNHQAVLRFADVMQGEKTKVPPYIKKLDGYKETQKNVDGKDTWLSDWSHPELKRFVLDFHKEFAAKYDTDEEKRIAFVETGFGVWAEYHITPNIPDLGKNFPDLEFQAEFIKKAGGYFKRIPWMLSIDVAENQTPLSYKPDLLEIPFGIFDDSFLEKDYVNKKKKRWGIVSCDRWQTAPIGGEFSNASFRHPELYSDKGPFEVTFKELAKTHHVSFIITRKKTYCDDKNKYNDDKCKGGLYKETEIKNVGLQLGYKFRILKFEANSNKSKVTITNIGNAPVYYDAYITVNGKRASKSLKGLLPTDPPQVYEVDSGGNNPSLSIESDRLLPGQKIQYDTIKVNM